MITLLLASAVPETSSEAISVERAWLILLTAALFYGLKLIRDLNQRLNQSPAAPALQRPASAPSSASASSPTAAHDTVAPEILAVISAAVHVALAGKYRIVGVVPIAGSESRTWSVEGRREVFRSHQLR